jgi:hypothetical protein
MQLNVSMYPVVQSAVSDGQGEHGVSKEQVMSVVLAAWIPIEIIATINNFMKNIFSMNSHDDDDETEMAFLNGQTDLMEDAFHQPRDSMWSSFLNMANSIIGAGTCRVCM